TKRRPNRAGLESMFRGERSERAHDEHEQGHDSDHSDPDAGLENAFDYGTADELGRRRRDDQERRQHMGFHEVSVSVQRNKLAGKSMGISSSSFPRIVKGLIRTRVVRSLPFASKSAASA